MPPTSLANLPDDLVLSLLDQRFPCRQSQLRTLATLIDPNAAPCRNCIVHGSEATGKSAVVAALLEELSRAHGRADYAIVNSLESITGRHLLETTLRRVAGAVGVQSFTPRCDNLAQLTYELSKILKASPQPDRRHFVLVFDSIDRQREAPPTLLPALARLSEIVGSPQAAPQPQSRRPLPTFPRGNVDLGSQIPSLTTVFILTNPPPNALLTTQVTYVHFPNYHKAEFVSILSTTPPQTLPNTTPVETSALWTRFCGAVHDALTKSAVRTLPAFQLACNSLWRRFTLPIRDGNLGAKDFSKLLIAARVHFQDESLLDPGIVTRQDNKLQGTPPSSSAAAATTLAALLPTTARILLIAAYLASHNAPRHDLTLFSTYHHGKRKRRGRGLSVAGGAARTSGPRSKHRKIARKLLGAPAFVLERMVAIFTAVRIEWGIGSGSVDDVDVGMALATLSSLRLLGRVGSGGDPLDRGGKWRVNIGWDVVRGLGRSMGVEVEEWLVE